MTDLERVRRMHRYKADSDAACSCGWGRTPTMRATQQDWQRHFNRLMAAALDEMSPTQRRAELRTAKEGQ